MSIIIPYIYNADTNTSNKHIYLKLYKKKPNTADGFDNYIYGTAFVYPYSNTNFIGYITISNTLGAEFTNIIDNYKPTAWRTQYWFTTPPSINTVRRVDSMYDTNHYFDMCLMDGMGYGTTDCPIVVGHITRF